VVTSIPQASIAEVRERADLLDVVRRYVHLERRGRRWVGLCPFHNEKTPSFGVSPDKQLFHCFGCQAGGDVYAFLMQVEGCSFPEAVRKLADEVGVELPSRDVSPQERLAEAKRKARLEANQVAARLFVDSLDSAATRYFTQERGLNPDTIEQFGLGWAPDDWDALPRALGPGRREVGLDVGLLGRRQRDGKVYGRFRAKLMFPIRMPDGQVVGFGARRAEWVDEDGPKYLNSPESEVYDKSSTLYGLYEGQRQIRQRHQAILTEGYFDVIALHQAGFTQAVASCGTALTGGHAKRLRRWAHEVVLAFDGDPAGQEAARKSALPLLAAGLDVRVLEFPPGEDPDSFVRAQGAEAFQQRLDTAASVFDHVVRKVRSRAAGGGIAGATQAMEALRPLLQSIPDPLKKDVALAATARALGVQPHVLGRHLGSPRTPVSRPPPQAPKPSRSRVSVVEAAILRSLLDRPDKMIDALETRNALDGLPTEAFLEAVGDLVSTYRSGVRLTGPIILERMGVEDERDHIFLRQRLLEDLPASDDPLELVDRWLRQRRDARLRALRQRIEHAATPEERAALEAELIQQASQFMAS
jgi:DNA primase